MRKKVERKVRMKRLTKVLITIFIVLTGIQLYCNLAMLGSIQDKTKLNEIMLFLGWTWVLVGQFITLHYVWEN